MAYDVRSSYSTSGTGTSFQLSSPAGATSADAIYAIVSHQQNVQITVPPSWSIVGSAFAVDVTLRLLHGTVDASAGPWTFVLGASSKYAATAVAVQSDGAVPGATKPSPDAFQTQVITATTSPAAPPTVLPSNTGDVVLYAVGWGRATTFTASTGGVTERADVSSGSTSTDRTLWVGSQSNATTAGSFTTGITVVNDNPNSYAADEYATFTVALKSVAPPTTWSGDFETGNFSQYAFVIQGAPDRITVRTDTPRQGSSYAKFVANNADVFPLTSTDNPRAQLVSSRMLFPGTERWIQWSTRFPADFPTVPAWGWILFFQYHGPPYTGSPAVGFGLDGGFMQIQRSQTYGYDVVWQAPRTSAAWMDFVLRVGFAQNETGFIELWLNGVMQSFTNGARRLYMTTVELDQNDGLEINPTLYRMKDIADSATVDHDGVRFDPTVPTALATNINFAPAVRSFGSGSPSATRARVVG